MKLSEALNKLKNLKSQVARVSKSISDSVTHYEDEQPAYVYTTELQARETLIHQIRELKTKIQYTNAVTKHEYKGVPITLSELILVNADLRSELAFQQSQLDLEIHDRYYGARTAEQIKKRFAEGYNKQQIREKIAQLEAEKERVEVLINTLNFKTELVGA